MLECIEQTLCLFSLSVSSFLQRYSKLNHSSNFIQRTSQTNIMSKLLIFKAEYALKNDKCRPSYGWFISHVDNADIVMTNIGWSQLISDDVWRWAVFVWPAAAWRHGSNYYNPPPTPPGPACPVSSASVQCTNVEMQLTSSLDTRTKVA